MQHAMTISALMLLPFAAAAISDETPRRDQPHVFVATIDHVVNGDSVVVDSIAYFDEILRSYPYKWKQFLCYRSVG